MCLTRKVIIIALLVALAKPVMGQNCGNDSTRITFTNFVYYNNPPTRAVDVQIFDRDSGTVSANGSVQYYANTDRTYTATGLIAQELVQVGSPTGWLNQSLTTYSYSVIDQLIQRIVFSWNGNSWDSTSMKLFDYDANGQKILEEEYHYINNQRLPIEKWTWSYAGQQLLSDAFYVGDTLTFLWIPIRRYEYFYNAGVRFEIQTSVWDSMNGVWSVSDTIPYTTSHLFCGEYTAEFTTATPQLINGMWMNDSTYTYLDTLGNTIYTRDITITSQTTAGIAINYYTFINGVLFSQRFTNGGASWYGDFWDIDSPTSITYYYDSLGRLIRVYSHAQCNGCYFTTDYTYGIDGAVAYQVDTFANVWGFNITTSATYATDSSQVELFAPEWNSNRLICPGLANTDLYAFGGCPPYRFQWYPASGLSSDTVPNPVVTFTDSVNYLVTVVDQNGHMDSLNYSLYPALAAELTVDSVSCQGQSLITCSHVDGQMYAWYYNGVLQWSDVAPSLYATLAGDYYVAVSATGYNDFTANTCSLNSDTVVQTSSLPPVSIYYSQDTLFLTSSGSGYSWVLDGVLLPDTLSFIANPVPGQYEAYVTFQTGCYPASATYTYLPNSISTIIDDSELLLYPQPASEQLTVQASGKAGAQDVYVMDMLGNSCGNYVFDRSGVCSIDTKAYKSGIYFLVIGCSNGNEIRRKATIIR